MYNSRLEKPTARTKMGFRLAVPTSRLAELSPRSRGVHRLHGVQRGKPSLLGRVGRNEKSYHIMCFVCSRWDSRVLLLLFMPAATGGREGDGGERLTPPDDCLP